jgi:serine/threonine protein kinase
MSSFSAERDPIEELADSFVRRLRAGEHPAAEEYIARYPEFVDQVRNLLSALMLMEQNQTTSNKDPAAGADPGDLVGRQLGDYRIVREVGRGGMGVVYEAVQEALGRRVALKVLPARLGGEGSFLERFRREAKAAGGLHHTNIVPVFGVGEHRGTYFYAMQFIEGRGLDRVLEDVRQRRQPHAAADGAHSAALPPTASAKPVASLPAAGATAISPDVSERPPVEEPAALADLPPGPYFRAVAHVVVQAADGLHHAHQHGVLHRDIKPSNLLLDAQGSVWITDFGLAKSADSENLTETGDLLGTLRYMAPERFQGVASPRSDVYALGATLYELLTLRPAYTDTDQLRLIERIQRADWAKPRQVEPRLPLDLETIVLKAMEPEPAGRYATAADLAEDLRRFLADRPIQARPVGPLERTRRWCRRNPGLAGALATAALCLLLGTLASSLLAVHALAEARRADREAESARNNEKLAKENEQLARDAKRASERRFYASEMKLASLEAEAGQMGLVQQRLQAHEPQADSDPDLRGFEWYYLKRLCHSDLRTFQGHTDGVWGVAFSPDGRRLAFASPDQSVKIWDTATGQECLTLKGHTRFVWAVAFSGMVSGLLRLAQAEP